MMRIIGITWKSIVATKTVFSAMLAHHLDEGMNELRDSPHYPMYASFKLDGIRGLNKEGKIVSRSDKPIPSAYAQKTFGVGEYAGLDGELVVKNIRPGNVYKDTFSACMTHDIETPLHWHVFDRWINSEASYATRLEEVHRNFSLYGDDRWSIVHQQLVKNWDELLEYEKVALDLGYEGLVVRRMDAPYKFGRSTGKQQWLMAMVRVAKSEFAITGIYEGLANQNVAVIDSRGYTTRSKHMEQMVGKGLAGGFYGRDYHSGVEFKIGVAEGLDIATRGYVWTHQDEFIGKICKYKYKPYGTDVAPRQPIMLWGEWRLPMDM